MLNLISVERNVPSSKAALADRNINDLSDAVGAENFQDVIHVSHQHIFRCSIQEDAARGSGCFRGKDNILIRFNVASLVNCLDTSVVKSITVGRRFIASHQRFDNYGTCLEGRCQGRCTAVTSSLRKRKPANAKQQHVRDRCRPHGGDAKHGCFNDNKSLSAIKASGIIFGTIPFIWHDP